MLPITKCLLVFTLFDWCRSIEYQEHQNANEEIQSSSFLDCPQFFHGKPWPRTKDFENRALVRLCQTQMQGDVIGQPVFASLFSTRDRIPVYTANVVVLLKNGSDNPRPGPQYWKRVATTSCGPADPPEYPITSNLAFVNDNAIKESCRSYQAVPEDYFKNGLDLDRGHLSPNSINSQDLEKQYGTFTLTNAAPQYAKFNRNSWREYECVTKNTIMDLVPGEKVYIITGTYGTAGWMNNDGQDSNKNPVKIPKYYWKAVCYPGNQAKTKAAWGYAIVAENINTKFVADYNSYISLKEFSQAYFVDPPFGADCMNAEFGRFADIFIVWDDYLANHCKPSWMKEEL